MSTSHSENGIDIGIGIDTDCISFSSVAMLRLVEWLHILVPKETFPSSNERGNFEKRMSPQIYESWDNASLYPINLG